MFQVFGVQPACAKGDEGSSFFGCFPNTMKYNEYMIIIYVSCIIINFSNMFRFFSFFLFFYLSDHISKG